MFLLTNKVYESSAIGGVPGWVDLPTNIRTQGAIALLALNSNKTIKIVDSFASIESGRAFFTVEPQTENVAYVLQEGNKYVLAVDIDNPQSGEFTFDYETKQVTVYGSSLSELKPVLISTTSTSTSKILLSACPPITIDLLGLNLTGSVTISDRFGGEPSLAISIAACNGERQFILSRLGNGTIHRCFNRSWVVDSISITEVSSKHDLIAIKVTLNHFLASRGTPSHSPMDKPLKLKARTGSNSYAALRSLFDFANLAGVNYRGANITVRTPRSLSVTETTTLRELVTQRAITKGGFVFWGRDGVEIRNWATQATHFISSAAVRTKSITYSYNGHGSVFNGVKLHTEYRNLKVKLDFDEDESSDRPTGIQQEWTFENCDSLGELYSPVERIGFYLRQPSRDILRNPGINFDVGGFTKSAIFTTRVNGTTTFEEKLEAGYAFSSDEVHDIEITKSGGIVISLDTIADPKNHWRVVRQSITDWIYDRDGYLERIEIRGTETARLQQESEQLEAVDLVAKARRDTTEDNGITVPDPSLLARARAYQFTEVLPISDTTTYTLDKHRDYYDDVVQPGDECEEDFIEPKFVTAMRRSRSNFFIKENPKNTEDFTYPPVVSGRFLKESMDTSITSATFPEKYEVRSRSSSNEGEYFKNSRVEGKNEYRDGKPGVHTKLNLEFDYTARNNNSNSQRYRNSNYYLTSPQVIDRDIKVTEGSKGYPDIDDPHEVKAIAQTELSITNTLNSCTTQIEIEYREEIEVGDFVMWQGKRWKVLGIETEFRIEPRRLVCDRYTLSLGLYLTPTLTLENRYQCQ